MRSHILVLSLAPLFLAVPAIAQEAVPGAEIAALVSNKTLQGSMTDTVTYPDPYAEFFDADGTIRGKDYTAAWTVEGDTMCFQYGEDPKTCYDVATDGEQVQWLSNGEPQFSGMLVEGNASEQ